MRVRVRFTKIGKVRFTSHRDLARIWERALRIAAVPVAKTEGFSPRLKMHFGLALPTSYESAGEYVDFDLREPEGDALDLEQLTRDLSDALPVGMEVTAAVYVDRSALSLQEAVTSCSWEAEVPGVSVAELESAVAALLAAPHLMVERERKGKLTTDDLRPGVVSLRVLGPTAADAPEAGSVLELVLGTQPRGIRPSEVLGAATPPLPHGRVRRTRQWIQGADGAPREPLAGPQDAASAQRAETRA
jgi:radical SAM-linked protein